MARTMAKLPSAHCTPMVSANSPRRNAKSQVMRADGNPIPRLYAVGECGSIFGMSYTFAMNLSELIVFGRVAGESAAKYPPL